MLSLPVSSFERSCSIFSSFRQSQQTFRLMYDFQLLWRHDTRNRKSMELKLEWIFVIGTLTSSRKVDILTEYLLKDVYYNWFFCWLGHLKMSSY